MKTRSMLVAFLTLASICGTASAEPPHPGAATAPVVVGPSCPLQADLTNCRTGLATCQADQKLILDYVIAQCPAFKGMTPDAVLDHARKGDDLKKPRGGGHHGGGGHKPRRPNPTPSASAPAVTILVVVGEHQAFTANADCKNGGYYLPIGFDTNGNKVLDADEVKDRLPACKGDKGDPGLNGVNGANARTTPSERFDSDPACPAGGSRTTSYTDLNGNGALDVGEENGPPIVLCDGGKATAHDGLDGRPGHDGTTVSLGLLFTGDVFRASHTPEVRSSAFGIALNLEHDWAEGTLGAAWSPGIDHGTVLTADFAAYLLWHRVGPRLGAELVYADINANNEAKYQMMALAPGVAVRVLDDRNWKMRAEVHLGLGLAGTYSRFERSESVGGSLSFLYGF